jgi:hypothetical protein
VQRTALALHVIAAAVFLHTYESMGDAAAVSRAEKDFKQRYGSTSIGLEQRGQPLVISCIHVMLACSSSRRAKYLAECTNGLEIRAKLILFLKVIAVRYISHDAAAAVRTLLRRT